MLLDNGRTRVLARRGRPAGAALHPLQRLPERLPRLLAHRRPRLRLGLPRADRRDPDAAARSGSRTRRRCRSRRASAAPATRSARSRSTSRRCCCTCAARRSQCHGARRRARWRCAPSAWVFGSPRRFALAQRLGRLAQRPFVRGGRIRRLPGAARRLDAEPRPAAARARDLPRLVGAAVSARDEVLGRVRARDRRVAAPAEPVARTYRRAGTLARRAARRALLRAGRRVPRRRAPRHATSARRGRASASARGAQRLVVPRGLPAAWRPDGVELVDDTRLSPARARRGRRRRSPAAPSRSPRPGRSSLTAGAARGPPRAHARARPAHLRRRGEPDRRARARGDRASSASSSRRAPSADARSRARRRPPTSSSTASRASTARARSSCSSSARAPRGSRRSSAAPRGGWPRSSRS